MAKIIKIELHFEDDDVHDEEVYHYLTELMENGLLHWEEAE
jgi:hypothetical protein